jgi:hypothetical protein
MRIHKATAADELATTRMSASAFAELRRTYVPKVDARARAAASTSTFSRLVVDGDDGASSGRFSIAPMAIGCTSGGSRWIPIIVVKGWLGNCWKALPRSRGRKVCEPFRCGPSCKQATWPSSSVSASP